MYLYSFQNEEKKKKFNETIISRTFRCFCLSLTSSTSGVWASISPQHTQFNCTSPFLLHQYSKKYLKGLIYKNTSPFYDLKKLKLMDHQKIRRDLGEGEPKRISTTVFNLLTPFYGQNVKFKEGLFEKITLICALHGIWVCLTVDEANGLQASEALLWGFLIDFTTMTCVRLKIPFTSPILNRNEKLFTFCLINSKAVEIGEICGYFQKVHYLFHL
ncbi:hypothetical protein EGR_07775 [Echinococcus granulosus]|uniref:Uncharacterized protein n=1 Tax=Echinococcus granulosus TaxID=6210 RepID=W6UGY0_ECHGR|nr:hypothetical protein EGR_07775 [Echinococcus granulosus]EUB57382.1 hypothetical protein EGR_07775 [Echinococcus granulosus]